MQLVALPYRRPWSERASCKLLEVDISNSELCPSGYKFVTMVALLRTPEDISVVRRAFEDGSRKKCYSSSDIQVFGEKYTVGSSHTCWWAKEVNDALLTEGGYSEKSINATTLLAVIWSSVSGLILGYMLIANCVRCIVSNRPTRQMSNCEDEPNVLV